MVNTYNCFHLCVDKGESLNVKTAEDKMFGIGLRCVCSNYVPHQNTFSLTACLFPIYSSCILPVGAFTAACNLPNSASLWGEGRTVILGRRIIHSNAPPFFHPFSFPTLILPPPVFTSSATVRPAFKAGRD